MNDQDGIGQNAADHCRCLAPDHAGRRKDGRLNRPLKNDCA
jgi:hypothetical protein